MGCCFSTRTSGVEDDKQHPDASKKSHVSSCHDVKSFHGGCVPEALVVVPNGSTPVGPEHDAKLSQGVDQGGDTVERYVLVGRWFMNSTTCTGSLGHWTGHSRYISGNCDFLSKWRIVYAGWQQCRNGNQLGSTQTRIPANGAERIDKCSPVASSEANHDRPERSGSIALARQGTLNTVDKPDLRQQTASCPDRMAHVESEAEPASQHRQPAQSSCHTNTGPPQSTGDENAVQQVEGMSLDKNRSNWHVWIAAVDADCVQQCPEDEIWARLEQRMSSPPCGAPTPSKKPSGPELVVVVTNQGDGSLLLQQQVGPLTQHAQ